MAVSPDGKHIISGSDDETIRIWDAVSGAAVGEPLRGHTDGVRSVAVSPDGKHIISGSYDNTVRIWDAVSGAAVRGPLRGHPRPVLSAAVSPDGKHIVSGSDDNTSRVSDFSGTLIDGVTQHADLSPSDAILSPGKLPSYQSIILPC